MLLFLKSIISRSPAAPIRPILTLMLVALSIGGLGCQSLPRTEAQAQRPQAETEEAAISVETAIAQERPLDDVKTYTGTTQPIQQVSLRAQTEGRLLSLNVDVGDAVNQGQAIGQIDDRILASVLSQARAELAARQSEVAQAIAEVSEAEAEADRARLELQQATADADRLVSLAADGAVTEQQAEQAQTAKLTAEQAVESAEQQVRTRQQAVVAAEGRVTAQRATIAEIEQRQEYALVQSPLSGTVMERLKQSGDLAQPGEEILRIGDFRNIKVVVEVSELDLSMIRSGQPATVTLDAFPDQTFSGVVERISPAADATARLIPVEIRIPNGDRRIGSGLLARVQFVSPQTPLVVIPEDALAAAGQTGEATGNARLFVVEGSGEEARAVSRSVTLGDRRNGLVQVRSGIEPGESVIVRSSDSLTNGQAVQLSILSEASTPSN